MKGPFGFVVIDKPEGLSSHDCVNRMRKVFDIKRVGHGGTLDPAVTGVLPIALGSATRLLPYLLNDKEYKGVIQLGKRTSSDDLQGEIISTKPWPLLTQKSLEKQLDQFRGAIQQIPPKVSSVHIQGERAYKRVQRGETFDLPKRTVTIYRLLLLKWDQITGQIEINVHCSSGTYIRSLARDLGDNLGCGACLAQLRRTQALGFEEKQAVMLPSKNDSLIGKIPSIIPPLLALNHLPHFTLSTEEEDLHWRTGRQLIASTDRLKPPPEINLSKDQLYKSNIVVIDNSGEVVGIATWGSTSVLQPKVVFNALG